MTLVQVEAGRETVAEGVVMARSAEALAREVGGNADRTGRESGAL